MGKKRSAGVFVGESRGMRARRLKNTNRPAGGRGSERHREKWRLARVRRARRRARRDDREPTRTPRETDERTVERVDESRGADQRDRRRDDRRDIRPAKP
jgi:hypothetical protein